MQSSVAEQIAHHESIESRRASVPTPWRKSCTRRSGNTSPGPDVVPGMLDHVDGDRLAALADERTPCGAPQAGQQRERRCAQHDGSLTSLGVRQRPGAVPEVDIIQLKLDRLVEAAADHCEETDTGSVLGS